MLYFISSCSIKVSILLFYRRLLQGTCGKKTVWAIRGAICFTVLYTFAFLMVQFTSCQPLEARWNQLRPSWTATHKHQCSGSVYVAPLTGVFSVVSDFYSTTIPAFVVYRLRLPPRQKVGLYIVFATGILYVGSHQHRAVTCS